MNKIKITIRIITKFFPEVLSFISSLQKSKHFMNLLSHFLQPPIKTQNRLEIYFTRTTVPRDPEANNRKPFRVKSAANKSANPGHNLSIRRSNSQGRVQPGSAIYLNPLRTFLSASRGGGVLIRFPGRRIPTMTHNRHKYITEVKLNIHASVHSSVHWERGYERNRSGAKSTISKPFDSNVVLCTYGKLCFPR